MSTSPSSRRLLSQEKIALYYWRNTLDFNYDIVVANKSNLLSPHHSHRYLSVLTTARTPRTEGRSLEAMTNQITPCWGRRACSGRDVWVKKAWGGRDWAGIPTRTMPSASHSSAWTSTDAQRGRSCPSWSATAWGTWASPHQDMVRVDARWQPGAQSFIS